MPGLDELFDEYSEKAKYAGAITPASELDDKNDQYVAGYEARLEASKIVSEEARRRKMLQQLEKARAAKAAKRAEAEKSTDATAKEKPKQKATSLKVQSAKGLLDYDVQYETGRVTIYQGDVDIADLGRLCSEIASLMKLIG